MSILSDQLTEEWIAIDPAAVNVCVKCIKRYPIASPVGPSIVCPNCGHVPDDSCCIACLNALEVRRRREADKRAVDTTDEQSVDDSPRCDPPGLDDVKGNAAAVMQIRTALDANLARIAKGQRTVFPHTLLVGPAGSGKTTLAGIIARECKHKLHEHLGQSLNDPRAMVAALTALKSGDICWIDEIHGLKKTVTETLYKALEERQVMPISIRGSAPLKPIKLPPFTLIGATTDPYSMSDSFKQRFQYHIKLKRLTIEELSGAIAQRAVQSGVKLDLTAAKMIAERSHGTPRKAVSLLRHCVNTALAGDSEIIDTFIVERACEIEELDSLGLDASARMYLRTLDGSTKPVRLNVLASTLGQPSREVEVEVERDLIYLGLIEKRENGRVLTLTGKQHLKN